MKKFIYLIVSAGLLYACNQQEMNVVSPDGKSTFLSSIASTDPLASVSEVDPIKLSKIVNGKPNARAAAMRYAEYGPFTVNATLNLHKSREKLYLTNKQSLYRPSSSNGADLHVKQLRV